MSMSSDSSIGDDSRGPPPPLDYLHNAGSDANATNDLDRQLEILSYHLLHPDPTLRWRAMWSIEQCHDARLNGFRLNHFHRWKRESVPSNDPYRDPNPGSKAIYFPGKNASHDAKCAWASVVVEECAGNDMRPAFDRSWERDLDIPSLEDSGSVISDILMACAPEELSLCLYIKREMIDAFLSLAVHKNSCARFVVARAFWTIWRFSPICPDQSLASL